jgi:formate dehydrogenase major subunit
MAEAHPVGFQWVMEAKARGAKVIHVDPRYSRTSALADVHVPIRAGADIAFVGGLINYVLTNEKYFRDYVVAYTNASAILSEDFADTEDLDGVFSGLYPDQRVYDYEAWRYQSGEMHPASGRRGAAADRLREVRRAARGERHGSGGAGAHPAPDTDATLQHPRCVFQVLKRHFSRYTPEMVARVAGVPEDLFATVCRLITESSGRDRTTAFVYSLGWTQHTVGVQYIRTAAILQALLGNMGRPGGGILAMRGHASIQGSTDIPTLFDLLPGSPPQRKQTTAQGRSCPHHADRLSLAASETLLTAPGRIAWLSRASLPSRPAAATHASMIAIMSGLKGSARIMACQPDQPSQDTEAQAGQSVRMCDRNPARQNDETSERRRAR